MEMPTVKLRFNNIEENFVLPRVPVSGDWIDVRGDEYKVEKVTLTDKGGAIAVINSELKTDKPKKKAVTLPKI